LRKLEVIYNEVGNVSCKIIPQCNHFREKITMWPPPIVKFPGALDGETYLLVMVDPDAPSRQAPRAKYWRHWVVSNIQGADLKSGNIKGQIITAYQPPTPPPTTGLHRYQFFIYLQGGIPISIPAKDNKNRGSWKLEKFLQDFKINKHETSTQYMTEFDGDLPPGFGRSDNKAKGKAGQR
ncbi:phosphatidylethanolamine-binding protein 4, partial [Nannospalax galili]|uniref:phosphatidylethanolamine-binding protein 4 n=1 Tax=Nannospalax galili TaxID=1026970 RepID=UPI0004ED282A